MRLRDARHAFVLPATIALLHASSVAHAETTTVVDSKVEAGPRPLYFRAFAVAGAGVGLRFNNPYRLSRPIGERAESVSFTAPYGDVGLGATLGDAHGFQYGGLLRYDRSLQGVTQHVITPSFVLLRRGTSFEAYGRLGLPLLLTPDPSLGGELTAGGAWFVRAGIGISLELIGDLFFGAATPENKRPLYPVLSGQLGVVLEWERLP